MILHVQKICYQAFATWMRANIANDPELVQTRAHFRRGDARADSRQVQFDPSVARRR